MIEQLPLFYEFGPFSVDAGRRLLLHNGKLVPLDEALAWDRKAAVACRAPVEVRQVK
jgi:hypothetical protein